MTIKCGARLTLPSNDGRRGADVERGEIPKSSRRAGGRGISQPGAGGGAEGGGDNARGRS